MAANLTVDMNFLDNSPELNCGDNLSGDKLAGEMLAGVDLVRGRGVYAAGGNLNFECFVVRKGWPGSIGWNLVWKMVVPK